MTKKSLSIPILFGALLVSPALAQAQQAEPPVQQAMPQAPGENGSATDRSGSSLSGKLSRSQGVITPPATGDQGVIPTPPVGPGSTPILPPPGTGNGPVQPK